jgi:hypothetical protein
MFKALWRGWLIVAKKIGAVQSYIVLTIFYFVALAPFALPIRLFSDPLKLRRMPSWDPLTRDDGSAADLVRRQS